MGPAVDDILDDDWNDDADFNDVDFNDADETANDVKEAPTKRRKKKTKASVKVKVERLQLGPPPTGVNPEARMGPSFECL